MLKLSRLFTASAFALAIGSQAIESPANAVPLAVSTPSSSLIAYTNTSSLANLMIEYRKANAELGQWTRDAKSAVDKVTRLTAELDRVVAASQSATPEAKAKLAIRVNQLVSELQQQKDKAAIAVGKRDATAQRLAAINVERTNMIASLTNDLKALNTEANLIKTSLRALN